MTYIKRYCGLAILIFAGIARRGFDNILLERPMGFTILDIGFILSFAMFFYARGRADEAQAASSDSQRWYREQ